MSKTMKWKDLAWLLLAACLLSLLLPWMKLNENGVTAGDLLDMIQPMPREELERELREELEVLTADAAENGYTINAEELSYSFMRILDGNLRLWQIPRVAGGMGAFLPELTRAMRYAGTELEKDPTIEEDFNAYSSFYSYSDMLQMFTGMTDLLEDEAGHYRTDALLYWIFGGLTLAGLILAAVCILRGKAWGCYVFALAVLALFVLNLLVVHRDNGLPDRLLTVFPVQLQDLAPLMGARADFFHVGGASVCCLILTALLVLHARFDLPDLFSRLTLRPATAPAGSPAVSSELPAEQPEEPAIPAEQPEKTSEETTETPEAPAVPEETAETPDVPAEPEETNEPSAPEETPEAEKPGDRIAEP